MNVYLTSHKAAGACSIPAHVGLFTTHTPLTMPLPWYGRDPSCCPAAYRRPAVQL